MFNAYSGDEDCHHQHQDIINKNVDLYVIYEVYTRFAEEQQTTKLQSTRWCNIEEVRYYVYRLYIDVT